MDGFAEQCRYTSVIYLLSIMAQAYNIIIYHDDGASVYDRDIVDRLNATENSGFKC